MLGHAIKDRWWLEFTWHSGFEWGLLAPPVLRSMGRNHGELPQKCFAKGCLDQQLGSRRGNEFLGSQSTTIQVSSGVGGGGLCCCCASLFPRISLRLCGRDPDWGKAGKRVAVCVPTFPPCRMLWSLTLYIYIYVWLCKDPGGKFHAGPAGSGQSFGEGSRRFWWSIWPLTGEGSWKVRKVLCKVPVGYRSRYSLESWEGSQ